MVEIPSIKDIHITVYIYIYIYIYIFIYLSTSLPEQDVTQGQFLEQSLTGLNSVYFLLD